MKSVPNLSVGQVYPSPVGGLNLNTCPDPDCGNFGVAADPDAPSLLGPNARAHLADLRSNTALSGLGKYRLHGTAGAEHRRVSTVFEYDGDPHSWLDRKLLQCRFDRGEDVCGTGFEILSNAHLVAETERLRAMNDALDGPRCRACGKRYLDAPNEFALNGVNGWKPSPEKSQHQSPACIRLIHKPCKGKAGARFSVSLDHHAQRRTADNVRILQALVNGAGVNKIMRMLAPSGSGRACGASRVYDRIFWLERTLLAFEKAQLARWREQVAAEGKDVYHHLAHDDVVLTVNWETSTDRRVTQLNCSATADVRSGYVFRLDVDFDPTVDPATFFEETFVTPAGDLKNLRQEYRQKSGLAFTAPLMSFQRPTGRFAENHFFAAAAAQLSQAMETVAERMPATTPAEIQARDAVLAEIDGRIARMGAVSRGYFDMPPSERDRRTPFTGIMTRDAYTKGAHFILLREMLPPGRFRLITEQEALLPRLLPHVFREEIAADRFTWVAMTFDKTATKPVVQARVTAFKGALKAFIGRLRAADPAAEAAMTNGDRLRAFVADQMTTAVGVDRTGAPRPYPSDNFRQPFMPSVWIASPMQTAGETNKVVGFPLLRRERRQALKPLRFDQAITDPETRDRVAWHVWSATLQPVSTFFNALRERLSYARRAGGRAARVGPSYVNGAAYNPRVLIAMLNIFRVYYNWFEARPYVGGRSGKPETEAVKSGMTAMRIPGSDVVVPIARRRSRRPIRRTPAMRMGIQEERHDKNGNLVMPSLHRVLYRPWLYWGTPVWDKIENAEADRRATRYANKKNAHGEKSPEADSAADLEP